MSMIFMHGQLAVKVNSINHLIMPGEYEQNNKIIETRKQEIRPVKGTQSQLNLMKNMLWIRETTCACKLCFGEKGFNGVFSCK